ncbi:hypothetical protein DASB73_039850 [Starmerella bacillaris]|uniref:Uncharacterized protein n=1 Tax=Starmerella bacillaris TaxID=1247836 RepID=A0AAV5RPI9_STABA|nr:hypothetical protein DASB73_039850 [Starmerella bacillaris]
MGIARIRLANLPVSADTENLEKTVGSEDQNKTQPAGSAADPSSQSSQNSQSLLPLKLRTPSGTVLIEVQGGFNIDSQPLFPSDLHSNIFEAIDTNLGILETSLNDESRVEFVVGNQVLVGQIEKLKSPLAVINLQTKEVIEIIRYRCLCNKRPEIRKMT